MAVQLKRILAVHLHHPKLLLFPFALRNTLTVVGQ